MVFLVALTPLAQQPTIVLAGLAKTPLIELGIVVFIGRFIKFLIVAYLGAHSSHVLKKLWGMKSEMDDIDIN